MRDIKEAKPARIDTLIGKAIQLTILLLFFSVMLTAQVRFFMKKTTTVSNDSIKVNLWDGSVGQLTGNATWNNWHPADGTGSSQTSSAFNYTTGSASPITATFSGGSSLYVDNGSGYGSSSTIAYVPTVCWRSAWTFLSTPQTLTLNNLPSGTYKLIIGSARNTGTSRPESFTVGGTTINTDGANNYNTEIIFNSISPSGGNQIVVTIAQSTGFSYVNWFILIKIS